MMDTLRPEAVEPARGCTSAAISKLVVRLVSEYTGRGPTKARTYVQEDLICVLLQDTLTKGESTLVRHGEADHVLHTRKMLQRTMRPALVSGIEELSGRRVVAFLSDNSVDPDISIEAFVMEPSRVNGSFGGESAETAAT